MLYICFTILFLWLATFPAWHTSCRDDIQQGIWRSRVQRQERWKIFSQKELLSHACLCPPPSWRLQVNRSYSFANQSLICLWIPISNSASQSPWNTVCIVYCMWYRGKLVLLLFSTGTLQAAKILVPKKKGHLNRSVWQNKLKLSTVGTCFFLELIPFCSQNG